MSAFRPMLMTLLLLAAGCSTPTAPSEPQVVELVPGASATIDALSVRFVGVAADSRCPADAMCIHQGDALVTIEARVPRSTSVLSELALNDPQKRRVDYDGYWIETKALDPYPFASNPTSPGQYRLTLTVGRR